MQVQFDIQNGTITPDQAALLAQQSGLWVFCHNWKVDVDIDNPPPTKEMPIVQSKQCRYCKELKGSPHAQTCTAMNGSSDVQPT